MSKIIIIGNGGTGKSTLGEILSKTLDIKVFHLDKLTYNPGWIQVAECEFRKKLEDILSTEKWIVEGWSYHSTLKMRLDAADTIIYLKFPVYICYWYALQRHLKYTFKQNPYDPEKSPIWNKTLKMVKAIWRVHKQYEPELNELLKQYKSKKVFIFRKRKEVNDFNEKQYKLRRTKFEILR